MPGGLVQQALADHFSLSKVFFQHDAVAVRILLQRSNQPPGMGHDPYLSVLRGADDQPCQRGQQVRMQAGLGLVEHHHAGRARCEQGCNQQQVAQGTVRQLGGR